MFLAIGAFDLLLELNNARDGRCSVCSLHVLLMNVWASSGNSSFLRQFKHMEVRVIWIAHRCQYECECLQSTQVLNPPFTRCQLGLASGPRVINSVERLYIFNSTTKQMHSSLQCSISSSASRFMDCALPRHQHYYPPFHPLSCDLLECSSVTDWLDSFVSTARDIFFVYSFFTNTKSTASKPQGDICWLWRKEYWIRIANCTFNK